MRNRSPWLLLLATSLVGVGCTTLSRLFRPTRPVRPNVVGVVVPLSGKYARLGEALLEGIRLGLESSTLELQVQDSAGEPDVAARALEVLASEHQAIAVLGGVASPEAAALARRANELGVPLLTFSKEEGVTAAGSYAFRNMLTLSAQGRALGRFATCQLGMKSLAVLAPNEPSLEALKAAFAEAAEVGGAKVAAPLTYDAGQTTFTAEARHLTGRAELEKRPDYLAGREGILQAQLDPFQRRKALERLKASLPPIVDFEGLLLPDGWKTVSLIAPALAVENVVTNACDAEELSRIRAATGADRVKTVTLLGSAAWHSPEGQNGVPELLSRGGKYVHCAYYVDGFFEGSARPASQAFVAAFRKAHAGRTPNLLNAYAYDSARMFRQVAEGRAPKDGDAFRDELARLEGFEGATGTTRFDVEREAVKPPLFLTVTARGLREVELSPRCEQELRMELAGALSPAAAAD